MKKMFMVSKATLVLLTGLALATAFWVATTSTVQAQGMSPTKMIEAQLPQGKTTANASKADYLAAVCEAVKKFKSAARAIVQAAVSSHPQWKNDILRSAFSCAGDDCRLLGHILRGAIDASPGDASGLTDLATQLAPNCATSFGGGHGGEGEGTFGNPPGTNLNPPPGSIGGGGGQGNIVAICLNGQTLFVTPDRAQQLLNDNPGATLGACQVTPTVNR
ncbi:MAG: hypothetical protein M3R10_03450 [Verrucomicrobiota bacterium]|nr:hypothetical protein [Verrucomicrobiota bacterium]